MESSTDVNSTLSSANLAGGPTSSKKLEDGIPVVTSQQAPVTMITLTAVILSVLQSFNFGLAIGGPNNSAVAMQSKFALSDGTWSWVVSIFAVGGMVGGLLGGPIVDKVGPKWCQLGNDIVWIVSGLIQALAQPGSAGAPMLMVGRALAGVAAGICCSAVPMYVNDISPTHVRGAFGVFHQLFVTIGILIATVLGMNAIFGNESLWWILYGLFIIPAVANMAMFIYPDSPRYLYNKGKEAAAGDALRRLRGPTYSVEPELDEYYADKKKEEQEGGDMTMMQAVKALFGSHYKKQIIIGIMLQVFQQLSGINAIMFYSSTIFRSAGMENGEVAACIVNAFNVLSTFIAVPAIERLGRRALLLGGFGFMGIFLILVCIGLVFHWQWPSVIFVVLGVMFFAVGPGPIPWMITSEILPPNVRPAGVTICVFVNWVFTFVVGQVYPYMNKGLGNYSMLPFAVCCFVATGFVIFMVPETRGKSLAEVEAMFGN